MDRVQKKSWLISLFLIVGIILTGCNTNQNERGIQLQVNIEKVPQLINGLSWGMSMEEIGSVLGMEEDAFTEREDISDKFTKVYEVDIASWNGYPARLRLLYCPNQCTDKSPLGLIGAVVIVTDESVSRKDVENILMAQYQDLYPEGENIVPSAIGQKELDWYDETLITNVEEELIHLHIAIEDDSALSGEEWAKYHAENYLVYSINGTSVEGEDTPCIAVYAMAFSAAVVEHLAE